MAGEHAPEIDSPIRADAGSPPAGRTRAASRRRRDPASGIIASLGSGLAVAGFTVLVVRAASAASAGIVGPGYVAGVSVYGACLVYRYLISTLAGFIGERVPSAGRGRGALRTLDEAGPFFLPAGTLMPLLLSSVHGAWRWVAFGLSWGYAILLFPLYLAFLGRLRPRVIPVGYILFFLVFPSLAPIRAALGEEVFMWMFAGGALYLFGLLFRGKTGFPYANAVWQAFALAASVLQYFGISAVL